MSWTAWLCRLVPYLGRRRAAEDLEQEMRLHVELERDRLIDAGLGPAAAARAARRKLGNTAVIREDTRAVWGWRWLDGLGRDLRHVARGLHRSPGFTATVVGVLALGIGATTAVFSVVHGVLLSPLPFRDPGQLVTVQIHIREMEDRFPAFPANLRALEAWAACQDVCAGVAAVRPRRSILTSAGEPRRLQGARVTANLFDLLGVAPVIGRTLRPADAAAGGPGVAILTHDLWQGAFGGDSGIVGRVLTLDDERVEVIGVLPESFWLPDLERLMPLPAGGLGGAEIFRPLRYTPEQARGFGNFDYPALVRLAPGITAEQAGPELTSLTREAFLDVPFTITPIVRPLDLQIVSDVRARWGGCWRRWGRCCSWLASTWRACCRRAACAGGTSSRCGAPSAAAPGIWCAIPWPRARCWPGSAASSGWGLRTPACVSRSPRRRWTCRASARRPSTGSRWRWPRERRSVVRSAAVSSRGGARAGPPRPPSSRPTRAPGATVHRAGSATCWWAHRSP